MQIPRVFFAACLARVDPPSPVGEKRRQGKSSRPEDARCDLRTEILSATAMGRLYTQDDWTGTAMSTDTTAMGHADLPILPNFRMEPISPVNGLFH